jgi:glycosyltransferase involved in cell wall biosynthesis
MSRPKICYVCSSPATFDCFIYPHARRLSEAMDIHLVCSGVPAYLNCGVKRHFSIQIERNIKIFNDIATLVRLIWLFATEEFDVVHSVTPKAGLLAMLASIWVRGRIRVHTFTGQVWATRTGFSRSVLRFMDQVILACGTRFLADSESQVRFMRDAGVKSRVGLVVLGSGSISGVNLDRFRPDIEGRIKLRASMKVPEDGLVYLYVGRLNREKGIRELLAAFDSISPSARHLELWLVGPDENGFCADLLSERGTCGGRIRLLGSVTCPERYMVAADILCLPSYREGFGNVIIEAAACGMPAIGSRIYGVSDAIIDGVTGLLHEPKDWMDLRRVMVKFLADEGLIARLGEAARSRVEKEFSEVRLTGAMKEFYSRAFVSERWYDRII